MAQSLKDIIDGLSLSTGLKLCLDAGDSASYNPSVQTAKWLDTSGNGYDFYRGTSAAGDAAEPTFNGSAGGLSPSEYWSSDGGDYFSYDTTNEAWMTALHKNGAVASGFFAYYRPNNTAQIFFFGNTSTSEGVIFAKSTADALRIFARNSSGVNQGSFLSTELMDTEGWHLCGFSFDETNNTITTIVNGVIETGTWTYPSPSAGNAQHTTRLLSNGAALSPSGTRLSALAMWEGVALTSTQLTDLYNEINQRFNPAINPELVINASIEQDSNAVTADGAVLISTSLYAAGADNTLSAEATLGIFDSFDDSWAINGRAINEDPFNGRYISDGTFANLVVTQESNSASSTASLNISATANETQEGNSVTSTTGITVQASAALTQAGDSLTSSAAIPITSSLTAQQASNGLSSYSSLLVSAFANNTQNDNTLTAYLSTGAAVLDADLTQAGNTISSQVAALIKADMDAAAAGDSLQALASLTIGAYIEAVQEGNYLTASVKTGLYRRSIAGGLDDTTNAGTLTPHVSAGSLDSGYAGRSLTKRTVTGLLK